MELVALYKRVIGLDIHQAQITACALIEEPDGSARIECTIFVERESQRAIVLGNKGERIKSIGDIAMLAFGMDTAVKAIRLGASSSDEKPTASSAAPGRSI